MVVVVLPRTEDAMCSFHRRRFGVGSSKLGEDLSAEIHDHYDEDHGGLGRMVYTLPDAMLRFRNEKNIFVYTMMQ